MSRPGVGGGGVPPMSVTQPSAPPPTLPSGNTAPNAPSTAPTAGAIGRALGPGTSDQEKVFFFLFFT